MIFYRTNSIDDPGHEVTFDELVSGFQDSDEFREWGQLGGRLSRSVMAWVSRVHGAPDDSVGDYGELVDLIVGDVLR